MTLAPEPRDERVVAGRLDINVRGDGELNPESVEFRETNHDDPVVQLTGEWEGDTDLFRHYPFGTYRIELLTDGEVVAHTDERISASRYEWLSAHTPSSLFVTRHGMVDSEWFVEVNSLGRGGPRLL